MKKPRKEHVNIYIKVKSGRKLPNKTKMVLQYCTVLSAIIDNKCLDV